MPVRDSLELVLLEYSENASRAFANNPLADLIRSQIPMEIERVLPNPSLYFVEASPGKGNWAKVPWVAIVNNQITNSVEKGYYLVYLFKADMSGFYLSLNQGVNEIRSVYKSSAKEALESRARDYVNRLVSRQGWNAGKIELGLESSSSLASYYEAGNILSKFYSKNSLPTEEEIIQDMQFLISQYEVLFHSDLVLDKSDEEDEYYEDKSKIRLHKRIERNSKLSQAVKRKQGFICKACKIDLSISYPGCGESYIEAHHLTPVSELEIGRIRLDPKKDFTVLCPNCHRMIHRSNFIGDVEGFKVECVKVEYVV